MIPDYFGRSERPRAVAFYLLGGSFSLIIGYFGGGWLNELYGWRVAFIAMATPGLILVPLAWFTLREPRIAKSGAGGEEALVLRPAKPATLPQVLLTLWGLKSFRHLLVGFSLIYFFGMGIAQWQPAFFIRSHGMSTGELGTWFALILGVGGLAATFLGGELATRIAPSDEARQLRGLALLLTAYGLVSVGIYLAPSKPLALSVLALVSFGNAMAAGPLFAVIQTLVPERMRAQAFAIIFFSANLIGSGFGPLIAGILSDVLHSWLGKESLRFALITLCPGYCWAGWHLWRAAKTVAHDIENAQTFDMTPSGPGDKDLRSAPHGVG